MINDFSEVNAATGSFFPTGYSLVQTDQIYPIPPDLKQRCEGISLYTPCFNDTDPMLVKTYVYPEHQQYNAGTGLPEVSELCLDTSQTQAAASTRLWLVCKSIRMARAT